MENREGELDNSKVAGTLLEAVAACVASRTLVTDTKALIEYSFWRGCPLGHLRVHSSLSRAPQNDKSSAASSDCWSSHSQGSAQPVHTRLPPGCPSCHLIWTCSKHPYVSKHMIRAGKPYIIRHTTYSIMYVLYREAPNWTASSE